MYKFGGVHDEGQSECVAWAQMLWCSCFVLPIKFVASKFVHLSLAKHVVTTTMLHYLESCC
jgi:hypothetical protein